MSNAIPTKNSISPLRTWFSTPYKHRPAMSSLVAPKTNLCWKRRQHQLSALEDSCRNGASKPDVSSIKTVIAKRRSQKF
jgi:hypothetical protein